MTGPFSCKISGCSCDLTALRKIKQLCGNAVGTRLCVTGLLRLSFFYCFSGVVSGVGKTVAEVQRHISLI